MKKLNIKIKIIILSILLILVLGSTSYYCYYLYQNNFILNKDLTTKVNALNQFYLQVLKIKSEKEGSAILSKNIDKIDQSFLPNKREDFLNFVVSLEN
jgi:LPS O-antigen subunit length determinant protein (WzzB/FepE family)